MSEWEDNEDDDDDDQPDGSRRPIVYAVIGLLILALAGVFAYRALKDKDSTASSPTSTAASTVTVAVGAAAPTTAGTASATQPTDTGGPAGSNGLAGATTTAPSATAAVTSTSAAPSTTGAPSTTAAETTVAVPATTAAPEPTTAAPTTAGPSTDAPTTAPVPATPATVTYDTLPDGNPAPIIVVYGADLITLSGNVPDQPTKDKLQALAIANARTPVPVNNQLVINPSVPRTIGVRVVELTSARFDEGSAKVAGAHALELDRITAIMNALPNITVLIVGHADQIGSTAANYQLSLQRANAVVAYLVQSGINPQRLSSRAVGDTDLLTLNDDAASLALNRRTEFIIYGLVTP